MSDLARRLSEIGLRVTATEASLERELAQVRAMRGTLAQLAELAWRLAAPSTAAGIPALALTDPPPRSVRASLKTTPAIRRQR